VLEGCLSSDSSHGIEMRQRAASLGMQGPPKAEPELTTSVSAALDAESTKEADANSDSEDIQAAEDFVDKLSARIARRGPAQVESTAAAQGAVDEEAAEPPAKSKPVKRRQPPCAEDELDEITLCVEGAGVSSVDEATAPAPSAPRACEHCRTTQLLRAKHCYDCGRCVATFDHHCFWIGNCVGG
jgi:hypothetical protein